MFVFADKLNPSLCINNPHALVVFGDNLICRGKAGQAIIRDEPNAFGIPTKRLPSMEKGSFFSDRKDEYDIVKNKLIYLWNEHQKGKMIILPRAQVGTGLANIEANSPKIHKLIERFYTSALKTIEEDENIIKVNGALCLLNRAPFGSQWGDSDIPENYILAEHIPENKIKEFEKLDFGVWIQDDTGFAVMYAHQDDFKWNLSKMQISKEDVHKFITNVSIKGLASQCDASHGTLGDITRSCSTAKIVELN